MNLPTELHFVPHEFNFPQQSNFKEQFQVEEKSHKKKDEFSTEDREHLKNAFRYITRLIFKEAEHYLTFINELAEELQLPIQMNRKKVLEYFEGAEEISGERYFRQYISKKTEQEQKLICRYMLWFLETKYLIYINEEGKGKRKHMKKKLYIKFKNEVMMPYLYALI